jgi:CheY-like chemotaxis protein
MWNETFLIVDDDQDYVSLVRIALHQADLFNPVHVMTDGEDVIQYLQGAGDYGERKAFPLPALIIIDLRLPGIGGHDVLRWIRERPEFRDIKVAVLTGSEREEEPVRSMALGADSFHVKPFEFTRLVDVLREIVQTALHQEKFHKAA